MRPRSQRRPRLDPGQRVRRDPRAERLYGGDAAPTGRPRLDPRTRWAAAVDPASGRLRIDRSRAGAAMAAPAQPLATTAPAPALQAVVIPEPAYWVLAVPDREDGTLSSHDRDLLGGARRLADAGGGAVVALLFGAAGPELATAGADRVLAFAGPEYQGYAPEARAAAVAAAIAALHPRHVLFPDTLTGGGDLGRRVAARLGEPPAARVRKLTPEQAVCATDGGRRERLGRPPRLLLLEAEAAEPVTGAVHQAIPLEPPPATAIPRLTDRGPVAVDPNAIPLAEADFIVSAGHGVSDWAAFHAVAAALGATEGGSRVVCDAGLLPRERQVGASGTLVDPRCYLAFGIAGAPQHLQGIVRCQRVVAVNTDLHAEMVKRADLAVIADAQHVMPALTRLLEEQAHDP